MKKIICLILIFCAFCAHADIFSYSDTEQERTPVQAQRYLYCGSDENPIRVASFMNYPPFGWKETQYVQDMIEVKTFHRYYGTGMELFKRFAKENNVRFVFVNALNFKEAKYALANGYFDVLVSDFSDPNTYKNLANFQPGYLSNPIVIVSLKANPEQPKTVQDMVGKKGYDRREEIFYDLFKTAIPKGVEITQVSGPKKAFYDLLKKKTDFILMSRYAFETESRRFKLNDYLTYSEPVFSPYIFMSYATNNQCAHFIKGALEKSLKNYASDETYMKSVLASQLNVWEKKFENQPSLLFETGDPEEETEEKSEDLNAWLEAQKNKKETK